MRCSFAFPIRHFVSRHLAAAIFVLACGACTPQAQLLMSLIPEGTIPVLLGQFSRLEDANRRRISEFEQRRDWDGLVKFAEENIKLDRFNSDWWIVAGYAWAQKGDRKRASECYAEAVAITPDDMLAWNLLAQSYRLSSQPERAAQTAIRALNVTREAPETWFVLAESYSDLGRLELAVKAYQEALRREQQYAYAWLGLGKAYGRLGRAAEVKEVIRVLETLDPAMAKQLASAPVSGTAK